MSDVADVRSILVTDIHPAPWNPRKFFDPERMRELEASITEKGVIAAILVRPRKKGGFEIVYGERRHRASAALGLQWIPAEVRELSDVAAREIALVENSQREGITALEEGEAFADLLRSEKGRTAQMVAARVGKPLALVVRRMKLLGLEPNLKKALASGALSEAHAEMLLRLTPALRAEATDPDHGVVWQRSPLFDGDDDAWTPTSADLLPLADLEDFIRTKSALNYKDPGARYVQPDFGAQLETFMQVQAGSPASTDEEVESVTALLVPLSEDTLVRSRLGLGRDTPAPLPPSQWREITSEKDRCEFATHGVIVHGGPTRILECCIKKRCQKHFPKAKVKKPTAGAADPQKALEAQRAREAKEAEARRRQQLIRNRALGLARPAIAKALGAVKVNAAFVRVLLDFGAIDDVENAYKVKLSNATAIQVLALSTIDDYDRDSLVRSLKPWRVDFMTFEKAAAHALATEEAAEKNKAAADKRKAARAAAKPTATKKPAAKKGGRKK